MQDGGGPYRGQERIKIYTKIYWCDTPWEYAENYIELINFVNHLLDLGIKREDIKFFENSMIYYVSDKQYTKTFLTILYYARERII